MFTYLRLQQHQAWIKKEEEEEGEKKEREKKSFVKQLWFPGFVTYGLSNVDGNKRPKSLMPNLAAAVSKSSWGDRPVT